MKQKKYLKHALKCRSKKQKQMVINKIEDMSKPKFKVAVYGTLREANSNHAALENSTLLGTFQTEPIFQMFSNKDAYPYLLKNGTTSITMEVYEFTSKNIMDRLDALENVNGNNPLYKKEELNTPYGKAFFYFREKKINQTDTMIINGDWNDYKHVKYTNI